MNKGLDVLELLGDVPCGPDDSPLMRLKIAKCGPTNAEVGAERALWCSGRGTPVGGWVGREEAVVGRLHTPTMPASGATAAACHTAVAKTAAAAVSNGCVSQGTHESLDESRAKETAEEAAARLKRQSADTRSAVM